MGTGTPSGQIKARYFMRARNLFADVAGSPSTVADAAMHAPKYTSGDETGCETGMHDAFVLEAFPVDQLYGLTW
ncbi:hypothetical protein VPNG_06990 [Cytospora leucostoma]|uniref:Uncharacterized protein n=1 Tax=Cytospora leucostoma TaxID=1230097 RepID=A0A423WNA0_9PEZI|nr:hypothetical protein VPNG_06990 [Cytospora leucostoma]